MKMNDDSALTNACEIAKILCANAGAVMYPNKELAKDIAEFIETLSNSLAGE